MIFTSWTFLLFFSSLLILHYLSAHRGRWILLLGASFFFYGFYRIENLALLIVPTLIIYFISLQLDRTGDSRKRRLLLFLGLISSLSVLFVFKYINFLGQSLFSVLSLFNRNLEFKPFTLLYTVGISFFTFKLVSYLLDVYHKRMKAEKHLGYFTLYVSFFPQLLAGPIDRAVNFIPELRKKVIFDPERVFSGFQLVVWGIFKKMVIADRLALFVNQVFSNPHDQGINLVFGAYFYAFQIYCDFSGYSDMAIGISRMLGYKSMDNFNFPYTARTLTQFWNKWHISLSTWLRDYLFLPMAYATMDRIKNPRFLNMKVETWGYSVGMFITMFLGGLWHGASWTFVAWGILHGIYLVFANATKKKRKKLVRRLGLKKVPHLYHGFQVFLTFNLVSLAWIFFKSATFSQAWTYLSEISFSLPDSGRGHLVFSLILLILFIVLDTVYKNRNRISWIYNMPQPIRLAVLAFFICFAIIFAVDSSNEFIYFQF